jgi:AcrR family transcriptional regulator
MERVVTPGSRPSHRERKKQQTRETIERVALELFSEHGYDETPLTQIADEAGVAPRTIFAYFQSKEDILFADEPTYSERVKEVLAQRPPGATTVDALREVVSSMPPPDRHTLLRKKIIAAHPGLQMKQHAHLAQLESLLAESIAKDLGDGPDDLRPHLIAASMTAALTAVRERLQADTEKPDHQQVTQLLNQALEFVQGGLERLQRD